MELAFRRAYFAVFGLFLLTLPWVNFKGWDYPLIGQFCYFLLVSGLLLVIGLAAIATGRLSLPKTKLFWLVGAVAASKVISTLFSVLPYHSIWGGYGVMVDGLVFFSCLIIVGLAFLMLRPSGKRINLLFYLLLIQASIVSFQVIVEKLQKTTPDFIARPDSPLTNTDYFLSYLCLLIPVGLGLLVGYFRQRRFWQALTSMIGLCVCLVAFYLALPLELQQSVEHSLTSQRPVASVQAADSPTPASPTPEPFLQTRSNQQRYTEWAIGWEIGKRYPLVGGGPGTTRALFYQEAQNRTDWQGYQDVMDLPHNDFIQQFAQGGILGFLTYLALWIGYFVVVFRQKKQVAKAHKPLFWGLVAGLAAFLLFNQALFTVQVTGILAVIMATSSLLLTQSVSYFKVDRKSRAWQLALVVILIIALPVGYWGTRLTEAEMAANTARAAEHNKDLHGAIAASEEAVADYPYEESYWQLESAYHAMLAIQKPLPNYYSEQAPQEIDQAITLNPYLPKSQLNKGIIQYWFADTGEQAKAGLDNMIGGIVRSPWDQNFYIWALQGIAMRPNAQASDYFFATTQSKIPSYMQDYLAQVKATYLKNQPN